METHLSNFDLARSMWIGMVTSKIKWRQFLPMTRENLGHNKWTGERTMWKRYFRITWIDRKLKVQNTFQQQWKLRGQVIWESNPGLWTIIWGHLISGWGRAISFTRWTVTPWFSHSWTSGTSRVSMPFVRPSRRAERWKAVRGWVAMLEGSWLSQTRGLFP